MTTVLWHEHEVHHSNNPHLLQRVSPGLHSTGFYVFEDLITAWKIKHLSGAIDVRRAVDVVSMMCGEQNCSRTAKLEEDLPLLATSSTS